MEENLRDIERVLGFKVDPEYAELMKDEWKAFCRNPLAYEGTVVPDMIKLWYLENITRKGEK